MLTIEKYFFWLMIYSIIGWFYESFITSVAKRKFVNRGFLNGPYCPIYGWGSIIVILVLGRIENVFILFFLGAFLTCSLEYVTSFVMEKLFHARWWDYSKRKFNINGRVCLIGAVVFGAFSVILIKLIHPVVMKYTDLIPMPVFHTACAALLILFVADNIVTFGGFSGFNKTLNEISKLFENAKDKIKEEVNEVVIDGLNRQQRRMIKAFPNLKSLKYENELSEIRKNLDKIKELRKNKRNPS